MEKLGIDLGFFQTKVSDLNPAHETLFETVVGTDFDSMVPTFHNNGIAFSNPRIAIGQNAIRYAKNLIRQKDDSWIESPECRYLFQAAVSEIKHDSGSVSAVVSLPIRLYKTRKGKLKDNLTGVHQFTRQGRTQQIIHAKILEIPQAFAVLCSELLNTDGQPISALALKKLGVIDIGGRTTNILLADQFRDVEYASDSMNVGCWNLIESLQKALAKQFNRSNISEYETEKALRDNVLEHKGTRYDLQKITAPIKQEIFRTITTKVNGLWPDLGSIAKIFLAGGGAMYLGEALRKEYEQATIVENPVYANARGAAKYARRI